jgi:hypothetical protein
MVANIDDEIEEKAGFIPKEYSFLDFLNKCYYAVTG